MKFEGFAHKFADNINTDYIIAGRYKFSTLKMEELLEHLMEDIRPNFYKQIKEGDFIVAGVNFGCGSSREQAPLLIKKAKIAAVIAKSFGRIFFRNAINIGLPCIECDTSYIEDGERILVNLEESFIHNLSKGIIIPIKRLPSFLHDIIKYGGIIEYIKERRALI